MGTQYFAEAIAAACSSGNGIPDCYERGFLDKFVAGLQLNLRGQADKPSKAGKANNVDKFDPALPSDVLAKAYADQVTPATGLSRWYQSLTAPRSADLFRNAEQASQCARALTDVGQPVTQDADVCRFAQASLEWRTKSAAQALPGAILAPLRQLLLLRTGDPLLLMQPSAYRMPLDTSDTQPCGADKACPLAKRMAQGFVQFELLIPVSLERGTQDWVAVGTSIADFERARGVRVKMIHRSTNWLPAEIAVEEDKPISTESVTSDTDHVILKFAQQRGMGPGITVASTNESSSAKEDMLFAPGDVIVLDAAN